MGARAPQLHGASPRPTRRAAWGPHPDLRDRFTVAQTPDEATEARALPGGGRGLFAALQAQTHTETDRLLAYVLVGQWIAALLLAGADAARLLAALGLGAVLDIPALLLIRARPGGALTRHVIAAAQLGWTPLLMGLSGGQLPDHHHVFASLVLLTLYRDGGVLATALGVTIVEYVLRAAMWPASVIPAGAATWIVAEDLAWIGAQAALLVVVARRAARDQRAAAMREARLARTKAIIERHVHDRTLELQDSAARYRDLVESMQAVTFEYDLRAGHMRYVSPQASHLLDCTPEELGDGKRFADAIHPDDRAHVRAEVRARLVGERAWRDPIDCRLVSARGRIVFTRTFLGSRVGASRLRAITLDVTRTRQLEVELQQAQKLESVGRLAAGVAHEINTPIQFIGDSVQFMAQALEDVLAVVAAQQAMVAGVRAGAPTDAIQASAAAAERAAEDADLAYVAAELPEAAARALDGVERVSTIVRSMKVFAHPDLPDMQPADLNAAIQSTLTIARNEYRYVADLHTELAELPPVTCYIGEINQVVLNIVVNAAHAIADVHAVTGVRGAIHVTTGVDGDQAVIQIRDTGGGIPDHVQPRIFDPFFTTKDVGRGTGQGLALARSVIVERHGGALTFDTRLGEGTTFTVRLPLDARQPARSAA